MDQKVHGNLSSAFILSYCIPRCSPWLSVVLDFTQKKQLFCSATDLVILGGFEGHLLRQIWFYRAEICTKVSSYYSSPTFNENILKNTFFHGNGAPNVHILSPGEKLYPSGYCKMLKLRPYLLSSFREKCNYFLNYLGLFWYQWTRSES